MEYVVIPAIAALLTFPRSWLGRYRDENTHPFRTPQRLSLTWRVIALSSLLLLALVTLLPG